MKKKLIYNYSEQELREIVSDLGESKFRADQIIDALYSVFAESFNDIQTLPKLFREKLTERFLINPLILEEMNTSRDGTRKLLFRLPDDSHIESVIIPEKKWKYTLCLSTQVGCSLDCSFCSTGKLNYKRNLETGEIIAQFIYAQRLTSSMISNIVYMGMGEPLLNYDSVLKSLNMLVEGRTKMIGKKRITLSTVGILPKMKKFREDNPGVKIAFSLHATTDFQRDKIIQTAEKWKISELIAELEEFYRKYKDPITFEYILFRNFNNSNEDINRLVKICRRFPSKINIIPYHQSEVIRDAGLIPADRKEIEDFAGKLRQKEINVFVRDSSGEDINAACGQLALSVSKRIIEQ